MRCKRLSFHAHAAELCSQLPSSRQFGGVHHRVLFGWVLKSGFFTISTIATVNLRLVERNEVSSSPPAAEPSHIMGGHPLSNHTLLRAATYHSVLITTSQKLLVLPPYILA
jgi:hypothetical protein